ncbi:QRFP-like peptide receptor [Montipora capricornis]|uniref:QRFP-like peptide receptor n=1 Tax=Montipora capricornis TaxID=246305 RepID=UPI0035F1C330
MATSDGYPTPILVSYMFFYSIVFILSVVGNVIVLCDCYRTIKRCGQSSIKWFLANLAFADLLFTLLSILDAINSLWKWVGGTVSCKLQGFLIEACYTASIMTLVVITYERRRAVITPFSIKTSASSSTYRKLIAVWITSLVIGSPLLYAYSIEVETKGSLLCTNLSFGDLGRQVYYSIHSVCIFIVPLTYMIYAQKSIFLTLSSRNLLTKNDFTTVSVHRHRKVAKTLAALSFAFTVCWAPFIIFRELIYFHIADEGYQWRACQLLIFLNTALDPVLYGLYGDNVKKLYSRFFKNTRRYRTFGKEKVRTSKSIKLSSALRVHSFSVLCKIDQEGPHSSEEQTGCNSHISTVTQL